MTGLSNRDNVSSLEECLNTPQKAHETESCVDFDSENTDDEDVKCLFDEFLRAFLTEVYGVSCLRPFPPVIGDGQIVDLLKLHTVVKKRGGYSWVSANGLWSSVVEDCGLDSKIAAALKLVYVKYLDVWDRWLRGIDKDKVNLGVIKNLMDLESDSTVFISGIQGKVEIDEGFMESKKKSLGSINEEMDYVKLNVGNKNADNTKNRDVNDADLSMEDDDPVSRKRKRECCAGMLNWIINVAKDPCCPASEPLPERQKWKWKCYGSELPWKQILLFREAVILKKNADAGPLQYDWQVYITFLSFLITNIEHICINMIQSAVIVSSFMYLMGCVLLSCVCMYKAMLSCFILVPFYPFFSFYLLLLIF